MDRGVARGHEAGRRGDATRQGVGGGRGVVDESRNVGVAAGVRRFQVQEAVAGATEQTGTGVGGDGVLTGVRNAALDVLAALKLRRRSVKASSGSD